MQTLIGILVFFVVGTILGVIYGLLGRFVMKSLYPDYYIWGNGPVKKEYYKE